MFLLEMSSNSADRIAHMAAFEEMDKNISHHASTTPREARLIQVFCGFMNWILIHKDNKLEKVQKHCKPNSVTHLSTLTALQRFASFVLRHKYQ